MLNVRQGKTAVQEGTTVEATGTTTEEANAAIISGAMTVDPAVTTAAITISGHAATIIDKQKCNILFAFNEIEKPFKI
jgi:hypothetical protein